MIGSNGRQVPAVVQELARAQGLHVFKAGDPAILLRRHKDKTYKALVTVTRVWSRAALDADMKPNRDALRDIVYTIQSAAGGEMTVGITSLRPGGVLDRMALELQISDEFDELPE